MALPPAFYMYLPGILMAIASVIAAAGSAVAAIYGMLNHTQNQITHEQNQKVITQTDGINTIKEALNVRLQSQVDAQTIEAAHLKEITDKNTEIALLKKKVNGGVDVSNNTDKI